MIYFLIEDIENGFVKVGHSENPPERIGQLQQGNPRKLQLIATIDASDTLEYQIKAEFRKFHIRGEWYRPDPEVFEYIRNIQGIRLHKALPEWRWSNLDLWYILDD